MPKPNSIRLVRRKTSAQLSDSQIETLAKVVCAYGDDADKHSEALLLLMDELHERPDTAPNIAFIVSRIAWSRFCDENSELLAAQIQLLRAETYKE